MTRRLAIDPLWCACTECITGVYVPVNEALPKEIALMLRGKIKDNTEANIEVRALITDNGPYWASKLTVVAYIESYEFDLTKWGRKVLRGMARRFA